MVKDYVRLLRPQQWVKNVFVLAPVFFSNNLFIEGYWLKGLVLFAAFCFLSSSIYCFNDIIDKEYDKHHLVKKHRPISSGRLSVKDGYVMMAITFLVSFLIPSLARFPEMGQLYAIMTCYYVLNIAYCLRLKQMAIIDVVIIAIGYVLRVFAGGVLGIWVSEWIIIMTFLLALFLALFKRRSDWLSFQQTGIQSRKSLIGYNLTFVDYAIVVVLSVTIVSYIMYCLSDAVIYRMGSKYLYLTSLWVMLAMFRIVQRTLVFESKDSPTAVLYHDRLIQISILGWILSFAVIIYL